MLLERGDNFAIMFFARLALRRNYQNLKAALARCGYAGCVRFVGDDDANTCVHNAVRVNAICNSNEIGAASREKNAKGIHGNSNDNPPRRHGEITKLKIYGERNRRETEA